MAAMSIDKFKTFIQQAGATILEPTNEYELVRFKTRNGVSVIYQSKRGMSFTGEAKEAWEAMRLKTPWSIVSYSAKVKQKAIADVIARDGTCCFFCGKETSQDRTLEHLLSVIHGGNNNVANLVLSCQSCNQAVGSMPIIEKVKYRETLQSRKEQ